jgi:hypothetical protein
LPGRHSIWLSEILGFVQYNHQSMTQSYRLTVFR